MEPMHIGHYVCDVYDVDKDEWKLSNDSRVTMVRDAGRDHILSLFNL